MHRSNEWIGTNELHSHILVMQVYNVKELCVFFTIFFPYLTKAKKKALGNGIS